MASKSGYRKKSGSTRSIDAGDKDRLIAEMKDRVAVLENELRLNHDSNSPHAAEGSLQFERLQLLSIFDSIDEVIYVADPYTYEIMYANRAMQDKFGKSLIGGICYREIQNKDAPCEFCTNNIILGNKGMPYRWEFHNPTVNRDFGIVDRIIKWPDGRDVRFEYAMDITERKRAEEALRESEEKYRELVENANSIIIRWDTQGNLTFFNEYAEKLFGYSKNEILGRNVVGTIVPRSESTGRDLAVLMEDVERYPERYKLNVNENMCKNGDRVWIAWTNQAIHDEHGNVVEILSVGNDITERKRAEEALRESETRLMAFLENSKVIGWMKDEDGRYVYLSQNYNRRFNTRSENWQGKTDFEFWPREIAEQFRKNDLVVLESGRSFEVVEEAINPDGSKSWWLSFKFPFRDASGKMCVGGLAVDITERKQFEEALKEAKAQAELYVDLMGHDINNMHQVSMGFLELARNLVEMDGKLEEDNIVLLDKAMGALKDSSKLIDNVRKIQRERMGQYEPELIDVGSIVEDAMNQFQSIPGRNVKITCNSTNHCPVRANSLLKDVFVNLVGNAVKHSQGDLTVNVHVSQVTDNGKAYCRVDVEDDGPGIPDTLKSTLFDRLNITTTRAKGKGFGLCLIKILVDDYRGKFWVEDRVPGDHSKGARFVVMLPAVEK